MCKFLKDIKTSNINQIYGLNKNDYILSCDDELYKGKKVINVIKTKREMKCPHCGHEHITIHDYQRRYLFSPSTGPVGVYFKYMQRRYKCKSCQKQFIEENEVVSKNKRYTKHTKKCLEREFRTNKGQNYTNHAKRYNTTPTTIINLFNEIFTDNKFIRKLPRVLCVDEFKFNRKKFGKYDLNLVDFDTGKIVDIVRDRRSNSIFDYFDKKYDQKAKEKVEVVIMDLSGQFRYVFKRIFPNAMIVADKFHYSRLMTNLLNFTRIRLMNESNDEKIKRLLKKYRKLLLTPFDKSFNGIVISNYNSYKKELLKLADLIDSKFYTLLMTYNYYFENINKTYNSMKDAVEFINNLINLLGSIEFNECQEVKRTFINWKEEIVNSIMSNNKENYNNGIIEANNLNIKTLMRMSYGLTNHERFVKRVMLFNSAESYNII